MLPQGSFLLVYELHLVPEEGSMILKLNLVTYTQPLTEMSTGSIKIIMFLGSKVQQVRRTDNLTTICKLII
jgi:hypothetical protein